MSKEVKKSTVFKKLMFVCILVILSTVLWGCVGSNKISKEELKALCESATQIDEFSVSFTYEADEEEGELDIIRKKENYRIEMEMPDQPKTVLIIKDNNVYGLDIEEKKAVKLAADPEDFAIADIFKEVNEIDWDIIDYIGEEKYNGFNCHVIVEKAYNGETKVWLDSETGYPIRIESEDVYLEVSKFKTGSVSDSSFDIPNDYEIIDLEGMFGFGDM